MSVSMRDVAAQAKVTASTVSKCFRGYPTIPESTRRRVVEIARRLGYRTHPYISALMQSRRRRRRLSSKLPVLAYVTAMATPEGWRQQWFCGDLFAGACRRAEERGYAISDFWLYRDGMSSHRFSEMLRNRGIRRLLLNPFPNPGTRLDLTWSHFSVVGLGLSLAHPIFHRSSNDPYATVMLALEQCSALGYRRPGLAHVAPINERLAYRWESAYRTGCEKMGFGKNLPFLMLPCWDAGSVIPWLQKKRPDVILGNFYEDELEKIEAAGLRVPHEIGIVGLSVKSMGSSISGIFQDGQLLGATAADKLIDLVERNEIGVPAAPFTLTFHPRWNPGRTLRRPA
jgi:LacI family transcriptional regulator